MPLTHISDHKISEDEVQFLTSEAKDYCLSHGMLYKDSNGALQHIPFTLFPSPFPKELFTAAREVQMDFNLLVHKVSQDYEFTKKALSSTISADPFTSKLVDIYDKVWQQGNTKLISMGLFRSDYLIDTTGGLHDECCGCGNNNTADSMYIKQVEMNTISLGGITFSCFVPKMHRYLLQLIGQPASKVPANPALDEAADGFIKAWELYGSVSAVVMFIVEPNEVNIFDQRLLEYHIKERNSAVRVIRRTLTEIFNNSKTDNDQCLFVDGIEVAVAYYRAGYAPKHYPSEKEHANVMAAVKMRKVQSKKPLSRDQIEKRFGQEWSARLTIELSRCIKCPTVAHQLMGTKKMQQVLAGPGVLERFLPDKDSVERVRKTFTGLYTLDEGPEGDHNMECCLKTVEKCVLKPQREGGGNNIYGEDIRHTLLNKPENRSQYILMDRIQPNINKNFIVRQELASIDSRDVIPEVGIMGILITRGDEILLNREGGYLVRTKTTEHADGGVFSGRASFDSPYMV